MTRYVYWLAVLLLTACSTPAPKPSLEQTPKLADWLPTWHISARLVVYQEDRVDHLRLVWLRERESSRLEIRDLLGRLQARITYDAQSARMETTQGRYYEADNAQALLKQLSGWDWPLEALPYWLQARAYPDTPARWEYFREDRPKWLHQQGWSLHYLDWEDSTRAIRPQKIYLRHPQLRLKIVLDDWFLEADPAPSDGFFEDIDGLS